MTGTQVISYTLSLIRCHPTDMNCHTAAVVTGGWGRGQGSSGMNPTDSTMSLLCDIILPCNLLVNHSRTRPWRDGQRSELTGNVIGSLRGNNWHSVNSANQLDEDSLRTGRI